MDAGSQRPADAPPDDKQDAYDTLHTVLETLLRVAAPFLPFLAEAVYQGLSGERSVHLQPWPDTSELPADAELVEAMDLAREVCSAGHSIRKAAGRRARLPLSSLTVAAPGASRLLPYADLIADEVDVQQVKLLDTVGELAETVLNVLPAALGPRLGPRTQHVIAAAHRGEWSRLSDGTVQVGGVDLIPGEYDLRLRPSDPASCRSLPGEIGIVALDLELNAELEAEGTARDVIRFVQQARREAGLKVTDRIRLSLAVQEVLVPVLDNYRAHIAAQVLATELEIEAYPGTGTNPPKARSGSPPKASWQTARRFSSACNGPAEPTLTRSGDPVRTRGAEEGGTRLKARSSRLVASLAEDRHGLGLPGLSRRPGVLEGRKRSQIGPRLVSEDDTVALYGRRRRRCRLSVFVDLGLDLIFPAGGVRTRCHRTQLGHLARRRQGPLDKTEGVAKRVGQSFALGVEELGQLFQLHADAVALALETGDVVGVAALCLRGEPGGVLPRRAQELLGLPPSAAQDLLRLVPSPVHERCGLLLGLTNGEIGRPLGEHESPTDGVVVIVSRPVGDRSLGALGPVGKLAHLLLQLFNRDGDLLKNSSTSSVS